MNLQNSDQSTLFLSGRLKGSAEENSGSGKISPLASPSPEQPNFVTMRRRTSTSNVCRSPFRWRLLGNASEWMGFCTEFREWPLE